MESVELEGVAEDWVDTAVRVDTLAQVPVAARKPADLDADSGAAEGDCTWAVDNLADCIVAVARTLAEAELAGVGQECRPRLPVILNKLKNDGLEMFLLDSFNEIKNERITCSRKS